MSYENTGDDWVLLTSSQFLVGIEILKAKLSSEGITAVVHNKMDSSYMIGDIEIHVRRSDYLKAKQFLDAKA
jgi:hypothetical protein